MNLTVLSVSFAEYCAEYGKTYTGEESARRERIYTAALAKIKAHNEGVSTYKMGLSEHTDKDDGEWKALKGLHRGLLATGKHPLAATPKAPTASLPTSLDWRDKGVVTKVKNQGGCGVSRSQIRPRPTRHARPPARR